MAPAPLTSHVTLLQDFEEPQAQHASLRMPLCNSTRQHAPSSHSSPLCTPLNMRLPLQAQPPAQQLINPRGSVPEDTSLITIGADVTPFERQPSTDGRSPPSLPSRPSVSQSASYRRRSDLALSIYGHPQPPAPNTLVLDIVDHDMNMQLPGSPKPTLTVGPPSPSPLPRASTSTGAETALGGGGAAMRTLSSSLLGGRCGSGSLLSPSPPPPLSLAGPGSISGSPRSLNAAMPRTPLSRMDSANRSRSRHTRSIPLPVFLNEEQHRAAARAEEAASPGPSGSATPLHAPRQVVVRRTISYSVVRAQDISDDSLSETELDSDPLPGNCSDKLPSLPAPLFPLSRTASKINSTTAGQLLAERRSRAAWAADRLHSTSDLGPVVRLPSNLSQASRPDSPSQQQQAANPADANGSPAAALLQRQRQQHHQQQVSRWEADLQRCLASGLLGEWVHRPGPGVGLLRCRVKKVSTFFGANSSYQLFLEGHSALLLAARKRKKSLTPSYVISQTLEDLKRESDACIAKLKASADEAEYTLWGKSNNKYIRKGFASEDMHIRFPRPPGTSLPSSPTTTAPLSSLPSGGLDGRGEGDEAVPVMAIVPLPEGSKVNRPEQLGNLLELAETGDLPSFLASKVVVLGSSAEGEPSPASPSSPSSGAHAPPPPLGKDNKPLAVVQSSRNLQLSHWKCAASPERRMSPGAGEARGDPRPGSSGTDGGAAVARTGLVLQLNKLADDSYSLSFGYPFSLISAFAVALSRMKVPEV